jgi:hypothetical protein
MLTVGGSAISLGEAELIGSCIEAQFCCEEASNFQNTKIDTSIRKSKSTRLSLFHEAHISRKYRFIGKIEVSGLASLSTFRPRVKTGFLSQAGKLRPWALGRLAAG